MATIYDVRRYWPTIVGDTFTFPRVEEGKRSQRVDAVIGLQVATRGDGPAGPALANIRMHFVDAEWSDLPNNFVPDNNKDLYLTFRPTRTYAYHVDLLRNEGPIVARVDTASGRFRLTTAEWEPTGS